MERIVIPHVEKIRQLARERWIAEGRPPGREYAHWVSAERELSEGANRALTDIEEGGSSPH